MEGRRRGSDTGVEEGNLKLLHLPLFRARAELATARSKIQASRRVSIFAHHIRSVLYEYRYDRRLGQNLPIACVRR